MRREKSLRAAVFGAAASGLIAAPGSVAAAQDSTSLADALALEPLEWELDDIQIRLGGLAAGALFSTHQSGGPAYPRSYNFTQGSAIVNSDLRVQRILDNGMILGVGGDFLLYHDDFSADNYDNDFVEKVFVFAQTGFGRVEVGQQDGAAHSLGLSGPVTNETVTLESNTISLFRDLSAHRTFSALFRPVTTVYSTSNFAKINYVSPRLFGLQVGASFTPQTVRTPLPFTGNPSDAPNQQQSIWEAGVNYTGYFSDVAVGLSAGYARGSLKNRTAGTDDLYDWALGAQFAYTLSDVKLSLGGAYRDSNAYLFDTEIVLAHSATHVTHVSATAEWNSWIAGVEYSFAKVKGPIDYQMIGYQISGGYKINDNLGIVAGWQWHDLRRNIGTFYNGLPAIDMNAGFLTFTYEL